MVFFKIESFATKKNKQGKEGCKMRLPKLKLNLRMKLPKLKLNLSHENFFKLTVFFWVLQFLLVGYLFVTSGWLGKVGAILIGWALFEANKRTFFKKIELKEKEYKEGLVLNIWTGTPIKVVPPEKIFFVFPLAEKVIELDVTLQQTSDDILGMPEGVEIRTKATIPFQPDTSNIMRYFQAGDVAGLIKATTQEVFKNLVSELKLKDALTETSLISSLLEVHLTKGPLRICFEKISALWQLMKKAEGEWEKEIRKSEGKFIETPEGRAKRAEIREKMPGFWREARRFVSEIAKNLVKERKEEQEEKEINLASEEVCREIETFINQIYEMGKDIEIMEEKMEVLITEETLKKIEKIPEEKGRVQEILKEIAEWKSEEKKWKLKGKLRKEVEERLEKSELEELLATKISSPLISAVEPTAEEIRSSIRALTSAGFRKQMLDEYARQKNITVQKFVEGMRKLKVEPDKQLTPKEILDALLIDAGRLKKTQFEIPGLKEAIVEVGKAVVGSLKKPSPRKPKEVR